VRRRAVRKRGSAGGAGGAPASTDAGLLVTARFQQQVAAALTVAIVRFLDQGG
jgi:hypothetical protein